MSKTTTKSSKTKTAAKPLELTGKERRALRALGHALSPVVQIGKAGLSDGVRQELLGALESHELIKVQLLRECPIERSTAGARITADTGANVVQALGNMLLLYKPNPEKPKVSLQPATPGADTSRPLPKSKATSKRHSTERSNVTRRATRSGGVQRREESGRAPGAKRGHGRGKAQ